jgi:YidC/Oxa1 family membrane protein insertase
MNARFLTAWFRAGGEGRGRGEERSRRGRPAAAALADSFDLAGRKALRAALESPGLTLKPDEWRYYECGLYVGPRDRDSLARISRGVNEWLRLEDANRFRVDLSPRFTVEVDAGRGTVSGFYLRQFREEVGKPQPYQLFLDPFAEPGPLALELGFFDGGEVSGRQLPLWGVPWEYHEIKGEGGAPEILLRKRVEGLVVSKRISVAPAGDCRRLRAAPGGGEPAAAAVEPEMLEYDPDLQEKGSNHLRMTLEIRNIGVADRTLSYTFYGPAAIDSQAVRGPGSDIDYAYGLAGPGGVVVSVENAGDWERVAQSSDRNIRLSWVGISNSYFTSILVPQTAGRDPFFDTGIVESFPDPARLEDLALEKYGRPPAKLTPEELEECRDKAYPNLRAGFRIPQQDLRPGDSLVHEYVLYAGPRDERLHLYSDLNFTGVNDYGMFSGLVKFFIWLLGTLKSVAFGSWGVSIILLTFLVKLCLHPINRRSQKSMTRFQKKFQKIQPKVKELQAQYKNDRMKLHQETQKLFKEHGVNPGQQMAGCLILLLQMPVWFSLYWTLQYTIGLRQAGFLYIEDLTRPDKLLYLGVENLPLLGDSFLYLNLLPVLYVVLTVVNQRLQPRPQDPQMQAQYRMMTFMMIFFGFIFYGFPAGFMLYIMTSSALGIVESKIIKAQLAREEAATGAPGKPAQAAEPVAATRPAYPGKGSGKPRRSKGKRKRR